MRWMEASYYNLKEMDSEYQSDSEPNNEDPDEFRPTFKKLTKNQQIYGDFEQAYEPEPTHQFYSRKGAYEQFKAGATIETYSSEVEVDLPLTKPKRKAPKEEEEEDDKPMLGKFTLNSFLNSLGNDGLREIVEEDEDSSQNLPEGLNEKILAHLQLFKFGEEEIEEEPQGLENMNLESYLKLNKPRLPKVEPKYKTQEEKDLAQDFKQNYGVGFKMLEGMGFKVTKGLGKEETGIQKPVEAVMKTAFTMKDEQPQKKKKQESESEKEQEETKELSIPEKVFQFRSRDRKINNFLLDLRNTYERLQSQIYNCQAQIESFQKEEELNESLRAQSHNEHSELAKDVQKLQDLETNIYNCENHPHLALNYKIDLLYLRELYDQLLTADLPTLAEQAPSRIDRFLAVLKKFYLAKAKESLREFDESTAIESKMHKKILKGKKKGKQEEEVIDLDKIGQDQTVTIGLEDEEKIRQFLEVIITKCILPKALQAIDRAPGIERVTDLRVIDLIEVVKRIDKRGAIFKDFITTHIVPKCRAYFETVSLDALEAGTAKIPSQVIFPWLSIVRPEELNIMGFYRRVAGKLWRMEDNVLLNLVKPWAKFSSPAELAFLQDLVIAPRLLYELEQFSISEPNPALLTGFTMYCDLLSFDQRQEILENTLLLQVLAAYREYQGKMEEREVGKWLGKWKKFTDKVAPGFFRGFFQEYAIVVE